MEQNAVAILAEVGDRVAKSNDQVTEQIISVLVGRKVSERVTLLDEAIAKMLHQKKELAKFKPDQVTFDTAGNKQEVFSKAKFDEKKKAEDKAQSLLSALDKAISTMTNDDFAKLKEEMGKQ